MRQQNIQEGIDGLSVNLFRKSGVYIIEQWEAKCGPNMNNNSEGLDEAAKCLYMQLIGLEEA